MLLFSLLIAALYLLYAREKHKTDVRVTRTSMQQVRLALDAFRGESGGACPKGGLDELVSSGYLKARLRDAWDRPFRLVCPSRTPDKAYDLSSDGPDGEPWGLDRVE